MKSFFQRRYNGRLENNGCMSKKTNPSDSEVELSKDVPRELITRSSFAYTLRMFQS